MVVKEQPIDMIKESPKELRSLPDVSHTKLNDYLNDMAKYALGEDRIKARECFGSIPLQLAKENKKFQYKLVKDGGSARHYEPTAVSKIDFIIYYNGEITPLEVKSGKNTRSVSFNHFIEKYNSETGIRFSNKNISHHDHILYMPLYALDFML